MAKDKKAKGEGKKAKAAEKKIKQANKADKKAKVKASKDAGSDAEENVDLDAVLDEYRRQQEQFHKISEAVAEEPPRPRSAACLIASPTQGKNELLLFGGEYFNGALATFFNDLHVYSVNKDEWRVVTSPNAPLPRSGHAWCTTRTGHVYLFGGEFSSPKQGTFYHYNDFWMLEPKTREWTKLEPKGKTPPSRSGHRLVSFQQYIILFGGFQDTSNATKYLADLWIYDTRNFVWYNPTLPSAQLKPDARSSFTFLPHEQGAVLFGGYSRVKTSVAANKGAKAGSQGQRNVLKPMIHQDCFFLRITAPGSTEGPDVPKSKGPEKSQPPTVRWERRKKPANLPAPSRAGATMAYHKGRGILFGGVHDVEEDEEGMDSEFFNQLFAWNVERNRFFPLALRKLRAQVQKKAGAGGGEQRVGGRRGRAAANEEELLKQLAALETGASLEDAGEMDLDRKPEDGEDDEKKVVREMPVTMELPHPRFNALLAVQDDTLYIYGGTFEKGDREFTFNDLYAIDLVKMDGCKEIFRKEVEDWIESEDEDDGEEDDDEYETEDEEDEEGDIEMADEPKKFTPSSRKKKQQTDEASVADSESTAPTSVATDDDDDTETNATSVVDDGLPYPRPFESRRDFFTRTSNEWQEVLMASLRAKGVAIESLTIKDIKSKAFSLSEEKWWDSREDITRLEEEQEAAGIGEVVSLNERGETGGGGGGGGGRRR